MNGGEGSIAATSAPTDSKRAVSAPGPQPTSSTLSPTPTPANATKTSARGSAYRPMKRAYASGGTTKLTRKCYVAGRVPIGDFDTRRFVDQSRQNSLPSTSCITMQDSSPSPAGNSRHAGRTEFDEPCALGLEYGESFRAHQPGTDPDVEMNPILDDLGLRNPLEEQPRPDTCGIDAGERGPLLFDGQRTVEVVPISEPLGRRWYDVAQRRTPETSDALRFCAVEGDLKLPDRQHFPTITARGAHPVRR